MVADMHVAGSRACTPGTHGVRTSPYPLRCNKDVPIVFRTRPRHLCARRRRARRSLTP